MIATFERDITVSPTKPFRMAMVVEDMLGLPVEGVTSACIYIRDSISLRLLKWDDVEFENSTFYVSINDTHELINGSIYHIEYMDKNRYEKTLISGRVFVK